MDMNPPNGGLDPDAAADLSDASSSSDDDSPQGTPQEQKIKLAKKEGRWVLRLRILTALTLLVVTATVCAGVFIQGSRSEDEDFESEFISLSEKLVASFSGLVQQRFGIIHSFGQSITAQAMHTVNGTTTTDWPLVSPKHYAPRMKEVVKLTKTVIAFYLARVERKDLDAWNAWVPQHHAEMHNEGLALQMGVPVSEIEDQPFMPMLMNVHNPEGPKPAQLVRPDAEYFYATWANYPATKMSMANIDFYGDVEHQMPMDICYRTGEPTFEYLKDYMYGQEKDMGYESIRQANVDYQDDAYGIATFPIFDGFGEDKQVAAVLSVMLYWRTYFSGLLPEGADGILVVLENTCHPSYYEETQQYTYQINGQESVCLGRGDLHDPRYDYLATGASINEQASKTDPNGKDDGLVNQGCQYSIRVYPSQEFEDSYKTNKPWIYTIIIGSLFVFTSAVFLVYDCMVEKRQRVVKDSALKSGTLVNSLFPGTVRDQLYQEQEEAANKKAKEANWEAKEPAVEHKEAIAKLHPDATIFFADLAGFTKWSSSRTPVEVFQLLEALYGAFDEIAMKRGVFKIETIGDCYVAATGLPEPQADHAVIMVRFAANCISKMNVMLASLKDSLGEDTMELEMRVGLHSGPVTAGVLRGQKSRFQLFGDTVNTASRMESNGVRGKIHVSQQTADELIKRGKKHWLTARPDKIVAKGKGELQTYFVTNSALGSVARSTLSSRSSFGGASAASDNGVNDDDGLQDVDVGGGSNLQEVDALEEKLNIRLSQNTSGAPSGKVGEEVSA